MTNEESSIEINKVSYGVTIGNREFGNSRPAVVEATLKPGKTLEEALDELDDRLNAWHQKRYPHLYKNPIPLAGINPSPHGIRYLTEEQLAQAIPVITKDRDRLEISIDNAMSLDELDLIKPDCWKNGLSEYFINKFNELNNGRTGSFADGLDEY